MLSGAAGMSERADIFLSYPGGSPEDGEHVIQLARTLDLFGLPSWVAGRDRAAQERENPERLLERVSSAAGCIACVGNRPLGRWGRSELDVAIRKAEQYSRYPLVTVLLPGSSRGGMATLPTEFQQHVFDLRAGVVAPVIAPVAAFLWRRLRHERAALLESILTSLRGGAEAVLLHGQPGAGKSALAVVVAAELSTQYPDGQAFLQWDRHRGLEGMADLALRSLDLGPIARRRQPIAAYQTRLANGRYLVTYDDVVAEDVTALVPEAPSAAIFVSPMRPRLKTRYVSFAVPPVGTTERAAAAEANIRPEFTPDVPEGLDLLSIDKPVNALCSVIAANDVRPPLSIALFGEWGAGKTFFIGKMQSRIEALAAASAQVEQSAYCSSIRQIVFNAWHYADANLWASLAKRVFEGLAGDEGEPERLFGVLASSRIQLDQADAEQEVAKRRIARAEADEVAAKKRLAEATLQLRDLASAGADVLDEVDASPLFADLRATLHLHEDEELSIATVRSLRTVRGALAQLWQQSKAVLLLCLTAMVAAVGLGIFLSSAIPAVVAGLAALGFGIRLAGWPLRWVLTARKHAQYRAQTLLHQECARLESELDHLRRDEEEARRRQEEARREVDEVEREIAEIKDGRRLFQFVAEKSRGDAYEPYLGLMALVRRDFERLSQLIDSHSEQTDGGLPQLERIVLYIDDLDRCPADRVVEVLEAVHLLMASKLFVVVVAVDPRWLHSSLQRHYARQYSNGDGQTWSPTPEDYLEKIFQIPFSLPAMADDGFRRLIENLVRVEGEEGRFPEPPAVQATPSPSPSPSPEGEEVQAQGLPLEPDDATQLDLEPEGLLVTTEEVRFMSKLGPVIRTPRAAKRLANIYRLVRASLTADQLDDLLGRDGERPGYRAVELMLAIAIGSPSMCPTLLDRLKVGRDTEEWWSFVEEWTPTGHEAEWKRLVGAMAALRDDALPDLATFAKWVPEIERYSYGTVHLAAVTKGQ
jgi:hypothetical protein